MKFLILLLSLTTIGCTQDNDPRRSSKWKKRVHEKHNISQFSGKARSIVHSQIILKRGKEQHLTLVGSINPLVDMSKTNIQWQLPEHIKILSGSLEESIFIKLGETNNHEIVIDRSSLKEGDRIFFFVYQMEDGKRVGSSSQYHHITKQRAKRESRQFKKFSDDKKKKIIQ